MHTKTSESLSFIIVNKHSWSVVDVVSHMNIYDNHNCSYIWIYDILKCSINW